MNANGYIEGLESDYDAEVERQTHRSTVSALEAEVRRLTLELRALSEAKVDHEASQLARQHGFLLSPFEAKMSTPLVSRQYSSSASPHTLNASTILDDEANFSFEDGWSSPAVASKAREREMESPTSRLLKTPVRPRPLFISTPKQNTSQPTPHFLHSNLVPLPEYEDENDVSNDALISSSSPGQRLVASDAPRGSKATPSQKPLYHSQQSPVSAHKGPYQPSQDSTKPSPAPLTLPPIQLTPETSSTDSSTGINALSPTFNAHHARDTPKKTPLKSYQLTPANGLPFTPPNHFSNNNNQSYATPSRHYAAYADQEARVLTKLVYVPRSTHWCEHVCLLMFILLVITISFAFGLLMSQTGPPEWLNPSAVMYS